MPSKTDISNTGDHHHLQLKADSETGQVTGLTSLSFSDNAVLELKYSRGNLNASILHSDENHLFRLDLGREAAISGYFQHRRKGGLNFKVEGGVARDLDGSI
jgi:hypothetical protein